MSSQQSENIKPIDTRIPVTILTGFLGAGKTTLLNHLIKEYPEKKFAVIENEFGETNIDSELIVSADKNIFELSNGCICCVLNEDLVTLLYELAESKKEFNHLLIETTGIADPSAVAVNFITDFGIQQKYRLDGVIALADVINLKTQLVETEEAAKQLALADLILVNKMSSVPSEQLEEILEIVKQINAFASIHTCDYASPKGVDLVNLKAFSSKGVLATDFETINKPSMATNNWKPIVKHSDISSVSIIKAGKLNPIIFDNWITVLLFSTSLYRVKGVLNMEMFDKKFIFQAVGSQFVSELGPDWGSEERVNKIVFIGKKLDQKLLEAGFAKCFLE